MNENQIEVLLTGANGQLGKCIQNIFSGQSEFDLICTDIETLDITNKVAVNQLFNESNFKYCINSAAYTAVDQAEEDVDKAYEINANASELLANACFEHGVSLLHVSTDYVYDSIKSGLINENSPTTPKSVYGQSKLAGEQKIMTIMENYFILRTSWLYSEFGNNFVKTMLKLGKDGKSLKVINDQFGAPTYAPDLAKIIFDIINFDIKSYDNVFGIYNFSNEGETNWYDFAVEALKMANIVNDITPVPSTEYVTKAPRPVNSRFDLNKIKSTFKVQIPEWKESLSVCVMNMLRE